MTTTTKSDGDFMAVYARLRTVLDGLEINALRYCLSATGDDERIQRAEEIEKEVMPLVQRFQTKPGTTPGEGCPDGYFDCGGVCVPYACVGSDLAAAQKT